MTNKKPRIAFCFSGQVRTLNQTYLFFQKNLFEAAKEQWFDYDVFCAVEDDENVDKVKLLNPTKVEKIKSSEVEKIIKRVHWDFIENEFLDTYWYTWFDWHMNMLQQLYKIQASMNLKKEYRKENNIKYDIVFKLRFDCPFMRKLNFKNIYNDINNSDKIVICNKNKMIPSFAFLIKIEDFYFIMNDEASDVLWKIFDWYKKCFEWHEITNKKINKIFCNIHYSIHSNFLGFILTHMYISLSHWYLGAEMQFLNYFFKNKVKVEKTYISIWWIKNPNKYKKFDIRTHSKAYLHKKSIYEL